MENLISKDELNIWADYLINYSIDGVTKDDIVMVKGENICWPLISVLQDKIFKNPAMDDPYKHSAGIRDGAMSVLIGIAARKSIESGEKVRIAELTDLEPRIKRL